ncbi:MAG TPA: DUF6689 family protein [Candidatus Polarisedimenticolia bacterium]|nr:DUF6689 family protein [Candidatus Polarisedimenticolia bacterium]
MHQRGVSSLAAIAAALALLGIAGTARAEVFVASPSTGRVLVLDSDGGLVGTIGAAGGLAAPSSLAVDSQRNLLVADYAAGRIIRYSADGANASLVATGIPKPDGLSIGPSGTLFLVSRDDQGMAPRLRLRSPGDSITVYLREVWTVPAGGGLPARIASIDESTRLTQTAVPAAGPYAGDVFVLSSRPGLIARLTLDSAKGTWARMADLATGVPGEPTGMAVTRTGQILVSTSDGRILRYSPFGQRLTPDFAGGLPAGPTSLSINFDGIVHVTPIGGTTVIRFNPYAERLADLSSASTPIAAALNSACAPTPVGANVMVSPAAGVNIIFDNVTQAGQTCLQSSLLGPGVVSTPQGNTIPEFARKLFEDPGFVVYNLTTTARFTDSIATEFFSHNPDARLLHAHGSGQVMEDITTLVTPNDPRGRTPLFSEFVVYLDTRTPQIATLTKLERLQGLLDPETGVIGNVSPDLLAALAAQIEVVAAAIGLAGPDSDRETAVGTLIQLKQFVRENSGEGIPNSPGGPEGEEGTNAAGSFLSWADSLIFSLSVF